MKRYWPNTLTAQLAVALFFVALLLSIAQYFALLRLWNYALTKFEQETNWEIASELAVKLEPVLQEPIDSDALARTFDQIRRLNWRLDLVVVSENGEILVDEKGQLRSTLSVADLKERITSIDVAAIRDFLVDRKNRTLPIFGDCPQRPIWASCKTIFSAAPIIFNGTPAYLYVALYGSSYRHLLDAAEDTYLTRGGALVSSIVFLASLLLGCWLFYLLTIRFRLLQNAVRSFEAGDLQARAPEEGNDEVASLGKSVNRMVETIRQTIEKLEQTDASRREMIASISHDLGGPLTATQLSLDRVMHSTDEAGRSKEELIRIAHDNVLRLGRLVESLFELSTLEAPDAKADIQKFSFRELVSEEILPQLQPLAEEKGVSLSAQGVEQELYVFGDADLLGRALYNLLENAIKYCEREDSVLVLVEPEEAHIRVSVKDTGLGIPQEKLSRVFDRFFQTESSRPKKTGSAGLGLAIVKQVCRLHDSEISVESTVGVGSCFSFRVGTLERVIANGDVGRDENEI